MVDGFIDLKYRLLKLISLHFGWDYANSASCYMIVAVFV